MATLVNKPGIDPAIVADLREGDMMECAAIKVAPLEVIMRSAAASEECFTLYSGNIPLAVWGYRRKTILGDTASVWLMTSYVVEWNKKSFAKETRRVLGMLLERFPVLECVVHHKYRRAFNWLGWLGFVSEDSVGEFHIMRCYREERG